MPLTDTLLEKDYTKYACNLFINSKPLDPNFEIISLQTKQAYQHITSVEIIFKSSAGFGSSALSDPLTDNRPFCGKSISVKAKLDFDEIILFEGTIVKHKYKNSSNGTRLQIVAKNIAVNMAITMQAEVFALQTDKDIIESIADKNGCTLLTSNITSQLRIKHTHLVKNEISDWDFINTRAEANGCFIYTEKDTITIDKPTQQADPMKIINVRHGDNVYELEIEQDDRKYQQAHELISFNLSSFENEITKEEAAVQEMPANSIKGLKSGINYRAFNDMESTELVNAATQLKNLSKVNGVVHIKPNLTVKPGSTINISGFNEMVNSKFIITGVMQDYSEGGFSTYIQFGLNHQCYSSKYDLPTHYKPKIVTGIVTQLQDDPDNLSRIQIKIASWQHAQESVWARLSTQYAGDQYGMIVLPEIGDEVIVTFIGSGFDTPIVIGSVFSPKFPPHTAFTDDNYDKVFVTKKGMKWSWNDDKLIHEVSTPNGNKIIISEEDHSITIEDENSNKIVMNNSEISLTGSKDINIKAGANIKIEGKNVDVVASAINTIKGNTVKIN